MSNDIRSVVRGVAGFVELDQKTARKFVLINSLYWLNEYTNLMYLWAYKHSKIILYTGGNYMKRSDPACVNIQTYHELVMPRYKYNLGEITIQKDQAVVQIMLDLTSALSLCHSLNIWHRDIKPYNIMISDANRAILIDFSHAIRIRTNEAVLEKQIATWTHRAPEVFMYQNDKTSEYNEKIDIWGLGVILWEMITTKSLYSEVCDGKERQFCKFITEQPEHKYIAHCKALYKQNTRGFTWHKQYWTWISKMLARDESKRISANELYNEILQFATEKKINVVLPTMNKIESNPDMEKLEDPEELEINEAQISLCDFAMEKIKLFKRASGMMYSISKMEPLVEYLVVKQVITHENLIHMTLALCILVNTAVYDGLCTLRMYSETIGRDCHIAINSDELMECVIKLMSSQEDALFISNRFDFVNYPYD